MIPMGELELDSAPASGCNIASVRLGQRAGARGRARAGQFGEPALLLCGDGLTGEPTDSRSTVVPVPPPGMSWSTS